MRRRTVWWTAEVNALVMGRCGRIVAMMGVLVGGRNGGRQSTGSGGVGMLTGGDGGRRAVCRTAAVAVAALVAVTYRWADGDDDSVNMQTGVCGLVAAVVSRRSCGSRGGDGVTRFRRWLGEQATAVVGSGMRRHPRPWWRR